MNVGLDRKNNAKLTPLVAHRSSLIFYLLFILSGCTTNDSQQEIEFQSKLTRYSNTQSIIELSELIPFKWDFVCISSAYEGSSDMQKRLGMEVEEIPDKATWIGSEEFVRFVFFNKGRFIEAMRLRTSKNQFKTFGDRIKHNYCFNKNEATLVLHSSQTAPFVVIEFQLISNQ